MKKPNFRTYFKQIYSVKIFLIFMINWILILFKNIQSIVSLKVFPLIYVYCEALLLLPFNCK